MPPAATMSLPRASDDADPAGARDRMGRGLPRPRSLALKDVLEGRMRPGSIAIWRGPSAARPTGATALPPLAMRSWARSSSASRAADAGAASGARHARRACPHRPPIRRLLRARASTRKVAIAAHPPGISAGTVSQVAKTLDAAVAALHARAEAGYRS